MTKARRLVAAAFAVAALAAVPTALATGGPNSSGNSGHFNPNSGPCQGTSDQPNCPGPTH
jgi:hypothetical protein